MMVVASGHPGVQQFVSEEHPPQVFLANSWKEVQQYWEQASHVMVGQQIKDFSGFLDWIATITDTGGRELVVWVADDFRTPVLEQDRAGVSIWRGELDRNRLRHWWAPTGSSAPLQLGRCWLLVSLFPYPPILPLVEALTRWADQRFGPTGGWVDLDWGRAELSMAWRPEWYLGREVGFERWRPQRIRSHWLLPSPPPWRPGVPSLDGRTLERIALADWSWQGWQLGWEIATPQVVSLLTLTPSVLLSVNQRTPFSVIERTEQFLRGYRSDLNLAVASTGPLPETPTRSADWQMVTMERLMVGASVPRRRKFLVRKES